MGHHSEKFDWQEVLPNQLITCKCGAAVRVRDYQRYEWDYETIREITLRIPLNMREHTALVLMGKHPVRIFNECPNCRPTVWTLPAAVSAITILIFIIFG
jgi:hypothetical protein